MSSFESEMRPLLDAKPRRTAKEQRMLNIFRARPSRRRTRQIGRMENHARAVLGLPPDLGSFDWATVDWSKWLKKIIDAILKFLGQIEAD